MAEEWMQKNWSMFQAEEEDMETDVIPYGTEVDVNKVDIPFQAAEGMEKFVISFLAEEGQVKEIIPLSLSPKNPKLDGGSVRRNSMGNRVQKSVPSYLRASSSSCHDFCKYGREHSFSKKEKQVPWRHKAVVSTTASAADSQIVTKNLNIRQQKKKPVIKPEPSIPKQTAEESSGKQKIIKAKDISAVKKIKGMDTKPTILSKSKLSVLNSSSSQLSPSEGISSRRNSLGNGPLRHLGGSSTRRLSGISPIVSSGCLSGRTEKKLSNLSEASNGKKRSNGMPPKRVGLLKAGERKKLEPSTATLSPRPSIARLNLLKYRNTKASSPVSNQSRVGKLEPIDNKISVKTLYMIESKPEIINKTQSSASFLPSQLSLSSCSSISSCDDEDHVVHEPLLSETEESDIEQDYIEAKNSAGVPNNGDKRRLRSAISHLEGKDGTPQKLSFRRGKVVNLQSENNGPRRLRFRQGRVLSESAKADLEKRSFRRKKELYGMELDKTNVAPPPIVLKHQDVQGKKEEQGLFNDVIEETANKLVETRKSKVKALVGAFETVISLHESKQSTTP